MVTSNDRKMNMLRSGPIRRRFNGSEIVFTGTACNKTTIPLKILITSWPISGSGMDVHSLIIHFYNSKLDPLMTNNSKWFELLVVMDPE